MLRIVILETFTSPGSGPTGLTWDGSNLWNADSRDGLVYEIDPQTGNTKRALFCPGNLSGLAWDGHALWQSLLDQEMIRCINTRTNDFDDTIILEGQGWLSGATWDGCNLWVVAQQRGQLLSVDLTTKEVQPPLQVPIAMGDIGYRDGCIWASVSGPMRYDDLQDRFEWLDNQQNHTIIQIDPINGQEMARYPVATLYSGLCWIGNDLWLAHTSSRSIHKAKLLEQ